MIEVTRLNRSSIILNSDLIAYPPAIFTVTLCLFLLKRTATAPTTFSRFTDENDGPDVEYWVLEKAGYTAASSAMFDDAPLRFSIELTVRNPVNDPARRTA
jgi:hypothetical protein